MSLRDRLTRPAVRPHLPPRTVRLRLTLLYGGLFLASGAALLAITYGLVVHNTSALIFQGPDGRNGAFLESPNSKPSSASTPASLQRSGGRPPGTRELSPEQLRAQVPQLQAQARTQRAEVLDQLLVQS